MKLPHLVTGFIGLLAGQRRIEILILALIFVINFVLDIDFKCVCTGGSPWQCALFVLLPFGLIVMAMILRDVDTRLCLKKRKGSSQNLSYVLGRSALLGIFWCVTVLIDEDWYVCCIPWPSLPEDLPCREREKLNVTEFSLVSDKKNWSRNIGFGIFLLILVVAFFLDCCNKKEQYKIILEKHMWEQKDCYIEEQLKRLSTNYFQEIYKAQEQKIAEALNEQRQAIEKDCEEKRTANTTTTQKKERSTWGKKLDSAFEEMNALEFVDFSYPPVESSDPPEGSSDPPAGSSGDSTRSPDQSADSNSFEMDEKSQLLPEQMEKVSYGGH